MITLDGHLAFISITRPLKIVGNNKSYKPLGDLYNDGKLILPPSLNHITSYTTFNSWLNFLYRKSWVVYLQKKCSDHHKNIKYLGRYLKRPPMAKTRIVKYDGSFVSYLFMDHHDKQRTMVTLDIEEFIKRLIRRIPDSNFRMIRYYNWLANRKRAALLPKVFLLLILHLKQAIASHTILCSLPLLGMILCNVKTANHS